MKEYKKPIIEDENLEIDDVIAVSNGGDGDGKNVFSANDFWSQGE